MALQEMQLEEMAFSAAADCRKNQSEDCVADVRQMVAAAKQKQSEFLATVESCVKP